MDELTGVAIHINGIVQGVGFRPFVYSLATQRGLNGWVQNTSAGVDIHLDGSRPDLQLFIKDLKEKAPPLASIDEVLVKWVNLWGFSQFEINLSEGIEGAFQPISPDVSICPDCLREMLDPEDRRFRYPFINCTNCGPRFTIIKDIPYDRPNTTMVEFALCSDCTEEYQDPLDRRFHAQPVACPVCGPNIWVEQGGEILREKEDALGFSREKLMAGNILAIKGLGGFHLTCDALNEKAVHELRLRKQRVEKPFAVMMFDIETVKKHCIVSQEEVHLLESRARPIVILNRLPESPIAVEVAPGQNTIGVMLPYTPLHYLLFEPGANFSEVWVVTSGNLSEEPIASLNEDARERLSSLADFLVMHNRDIYTRVDDSVMRVLPPSSSTGSDGCIVYPVRRARGYAPFPVQLPWKLPQVLAAGPELKNTFCVTKDNYAFISHHIGDMENFETLQAFEKSMAHYEQLFRISPQIIAYDLHPNYLATRYALQKSEEERLPALGIQHHHAHIAACMVDNGLDAGEHVIGISFDGTGYGTDGAIWGGEVLLANYESFERVYHLKYFPLAGGDNAIRNPWRLALAVLKAAGIPWDSDIPSVDHILTQEDGDEQLKLLNNQLSSGVNMIPTSSMGRLFDAVSSLVGVRQQINYEAQAAIEFEQLVDPTEEGHYRFALHDGQIDPTPMLHELLDDIRDCARVGVISSRFHRGIAKTVLQLCQVIREESGLDTVALSGGVWQNITLLAWTQQYLCDNGFKVLIHRKVPANDGGLSLGQAVIAGQYLKERK
ncbi:MAG: carbamoyltransferase HypF [Anaerolineales bacterium]|nr:carbamoyltransferase HypF [Anaerolineales bacterium]